MTELELDYWVWDPTQSRLCDEKSLYLTIEVGGELMLKNPTTGEIKPPHDRVQPITPNKYSNFLEKIQRKKALLRKLEREGHPRV